MTAGQIGLAAWHLNVSLFHFWISNSFVGFVFFIIIYVAI